MDNDHCLVVSPLNQNFLDVIVVSCKNLMILNINFILICLWLLVLFYFYFYRFVIEISNWMRKCSSKSHLTVKSIFLIMIFACHCNIHDNEIAIRITFRIGNWTPQSQEKYFRENLIHTLVFELILRTLKGIMDYSNSCYNTTQVVYCTIINQYI